MIRDQQKNLHKHIQSFLSRKDKEFPDLELTKKWHDYEELPTNTQKGQ